MIFQNETVTKYSYTMITQYLHAHNRFRTICSINTTTTSLKIEVLRNTSQMKLSFSMA